MRSSPKPFSPPKQDKSKPSKKELRAGHKNANQPKAGTSREKPPAQGIIQGNTSRDHIYRIFVIFSEVQNERYPTPKKLAALCDVKDRTILRDIDQINGLLSNFETTHEKVGRVDTNAIEFDHQKGGYRLRHKLNHFPIIRVEDPDLLTLHFLRQCLEPYKDTGIGKSMIESFNRTFGILTGTTDWKQWERIVHFRFEGKPEVAKEDVKLFDLLHKAIRENLQVSLDYKPAKDPKSTRIIEPHFLFMRNGSWYLYASKAGKPEKRTLKFARISNAKLTGEKFTHVRMDPKDCFEYSFGVVPSQSKALKNPVVLEFTKESAQRVSETLWHPEQKVKDLPGGGVRLELPFDEPTYLELKPWILSWGASARIIGPKALKDKVAEDVRAMAAAL
jgi:predicted DNA-binding transcriptional regulator YafY